MKPPLSERLARGALGDAAAFAAGAILPLGFAPLAWFPLTILSLVALFALWLRASPARAAWRGFLFGFGMFAVGVSWVYVSLHNFGNMPMPLATFTVVLFCAGLALYPLLFGYLQAKLFSGSPRLRVLLVMPALWVMAEWMRAWFLTGFPWLNLGYSHIDTPLAGFAPWLGVYGVSLVVAMSAGLIVAAWSDRAHAWTRYVPALVVLWVGGWLAGQPSWVTPVDGTVRVALVQGNIALGRKWDPRERAAILERYGDLSERAADARVIIWPEAAIPTYLDRVDPEFLQRLRARARERNSEILAGVVERERAGNRTEVYNSVVRLDAETGTYRKRHLVPFGEFLPLPFLFQWFIDNFQIPMADFASGPRAQPLLTVAGQPVGISVCYEDAFGEEVIESLPRATLLINVSEDAWFGDSFAPHQRLQMARLRALEAGRPMLRAANTGPSALIDHRGKVVAESAQFRAETLVVTVQPMQGATPYVRVGNVAIVVLLVGMVAAAWMLGRRIKAAG